MHNIKLMLKLLTGRKNMDHREKTIKLMHEFLQNFISQYIIAGSLISRLRIWCGVMKAL